MSEAGPEFTSGGINKYVTKYVRSLPDLTGKAVLDVPCGDGRTSYEFAKKGATVTPVDLFPEFFRVPGHQPLYGDLAGKLPIDDQSMDFVVCQEGIEHLPNQVHVFEEFNRVLKTGGHLILTTPNYSHLRSRVSQLFFETDFWKRMPPTEIDSVWFSDSDDNHIYFGHLFLIGVQKLLTLAKICGFEMARNIRSDIGSTSAMLGVLWPMLWISSKWTALQYKKKLDSMDTSFVTQLFDERVKLNVHPNTLFCKHTFWLLRKEESVRQRRATLRKKLKSD